MENVSSAEWSLLIVGSVVLLLICLWAGTQEGVKPPKKFPRLGIFDYFEDWLEPEPAYEVAEYELLRMSAMSVVTDMAQAATGKSPLELARRPDDHRLAIYNQEDPATGKRHNYLVGPWFPGKVTHSYFESTQEVVWERWGIKDPDPDAIPRLAGVVQEREPRQRSVSYPVWDYDPADCYPLIGV